MKQRAGLAFALVGRPQFLILDEPVNGLDAESVEWLRRALLTFCREEGGTVLISSHLLQELQSFVDRVVILSRGRVVMDGELMALREQASCDATTDDPDRLRAVLDEGGIGWVAGEDRRRFTIDADSRTVAELALGHRILGERLCQWRVAASVDRSDRSCTSSCGRSSGPGPARSSSW